MLAEESRPQGWRLIVLALAIFAAMCVLINRLWTVQIVNSDSAKKTMEANTTVKARIAPARGSICDRFGVMLAENRPSFDLDFYLSDLRRDYAESHHGHVPLRDLPGKDKRGNPLKEVDIVQIVKESIAPIKDALGMTQTLTDKDEKDIREHYRTNADLPYHYMRDLDFATVCNFEEQNLGVTGIRISQSPARQYTYGAFASHILGYVGKPVDQSKHLSSDGTPYETIGRHGIEAIMDPKLQGEPGSVFRRVSSQGYYVGDPLQTISPTMGNTLYLTIDSRIQYIAETAMAKSGWTRGAIIVMNPNNGDVLALASFPNYDPNKFIPSISPKDWNTLNQDPTTPLFNRALHTFEPGSTYKIMVALAGLRSGRVTPNTEIDCPGAIQIDDHLFHNSDRSPAGTMSLVNAIKVSSDVFFYQYGIKAGIDAIDAMGARVGFGHKWGLLGDDDEDAGILPGPEWMKKNDDWLRKTHNINHWSNAQTANTSIGQGFVQVTPLQMATFLCAVANGGTVYQPRIYSRVVTSEGKDLPAPVEGLVYNTLDVKPSDLRAVQRGMYEVVEEPGGTANATAKIPNVHLAGKTGTAQAYTRLNGVRKQDLSTWFYCYGPFESPRYVVCVLVKGGQWGGTAAAPIASEIMRRCLALDQGAIETVTPLKPIIGNFNGVTDVETHEAASKPGDTTSGDNAGGGDNDNTPSGDMPPVPTAVPKGSSKSNR